MFRQQWRRRAGGKFYLVRSGCLVSLAPRSRCHRHNTLSLLHIKPLSRREPCCTRDEHKVEGRGSRFPEPGALGGLLSASCTLGGSAERPAAPCGTLRMARPESWAWLAAAAIAWCSCRVSARGPTRPVPLICAPTASARLPPAHCCRRTPALASVCIIAVAAPLMMADHLLKCETRLCFVMGMDSRLAPSYLIPLPVLLLLMQPALLAAWSLAGAAARMGSWGTATQRTGSTRRLCSRS